MSRDVLAADAHGGPDLGLGPPWPGRSVAALGGSAAAAAGGGPSGRAAAEGAAGLAAEVLWGAKVPGAPWPLPPLPPVCCQPKGHELAQKEEILRLQQQLHGSQADAQLAKGRQEELDRELQRLRARLASEEVDKEVQARLLRTEEELRQARLQLQRAEDDRRKADVRAKQAELQIADAESAVRDRLAREVHRLQDLLAVPHDGGEQTAVALRRGGVALMLELEGTLAERIDLVAAKLADLARGQNHRHDAALRQESLATRQLEAAKVQIRDLQDENRRLVILREQMEEVSDEVAQLRRQKAELERDLQMRDRAAQEADEQYRTRAHMEISKAKRLEEQLLLVEDSSLAVERKLQEESKERRRLEKEVETLRRANTDLQARMREELRQELGQQSTRTSRLQEQLEAAEQRARTATKEVEILRRELDAVRREAEADRRRYEEQLRGASQKVAQAESERRILEDRVKELQADIRHLREAERERSIARAERDAADELVRERSASMAAVDALAVSRERRSLTFTEGLRPRASSAAAGVGAAQLLVERGRAVSAALLVGAGAGQRERAGSALAEERTASFGASPTSERGTGAASVAGAAERAVVTRTGSRRSQEIRSIMEDRLLEETGDREADNLVQDALERPDWSEAAVTSRSRARSSLGSDLSATHFEHAGAVRDHILGIGSGVVTGGGLHTFHDSPPMPPDDGVQAPATARSRLGTQADLTEEMGL